MDSIRNLLAFSFCDITKCTASLFHTFFFSYLTASFQRLLLSIICLATFFFFFLAHPLLPRFHFSHYSQQSFKDVVFLATDNKQKKIVESSLKKKKKEHVLYHFIMDAAKT